MKYNLLRVERYPDPRKPDPARPDPETYRVHVEKEMLVLPKKCTIEDAKIASLTNKLNSGRDDLISKLKEVSINKLSIQDFTSLFFLQIQAELENGRIKGDELRFEIL